MRLKSLLWPAVGVMPLPETHPQVEAAVALCCPIPVLVPGDRWAKRDCWGKNDKKRCACKPPLVTVQLFRWGSQSCFFVTILVLRGQQSGCPPVDPFLPEEMGFPFFATDS